MEERTRKVRKTREQLQAEAEARKVSPGVYCREIPAAPDHVNCRCVPERMKATDFFNRFGGDMYTPERILRNGPATVVFWVDGTKTVVKPGPNVTPNDYDAFTAALAIKVFGNNSHLKKLIKAKTVVEKPKKKKGKEPAVLEAEAVVEG